MANGIETGGILGSGGTVPQNKPKSDENLTGGERRNVYNNSDSKDRRIIQDPDPKIKEVKANSRQRINTVTNDDPVNPYKNDQLWGGKSLESLSN